MAPPDPVHTSPGHCPSVPAASVGLGPQDTAACGPEAPWRPLYPFASHRLRLSCGYHLHYLDEGPGPQAPVVLMLHGNPTWSFFYRRLIQRLRPHVRCIVPDHLGMGLSDTPSAAQASGLLSLPQRIGHLRELLAHCGVQHYSLVAHDWGGPIGLGLALGVGHSAAARRPLPVQRCVLMNTAAFTSQRIPPSIALCRLPILGQWLVQQANAFVRGSLSWASSQGLPPQVTQGYQAPYTQARYRLGIHHFIQDIPLRPTHPSWDTLASIEQRLPALNTLPTLLCWGMKDFCFTPHFLDEFRKRIPYAAVRRSDQAGHYLLEDDPALVDSTLPEFLLA